MVTVASNKCLHNNERQMRGNKCSDGGSGGGDGCEGGGSE